MEREDYPPALAKLEARFNNEASCREYLIRPRREQFLGAGRLLNCCRRFTGLSLLKRWLWGPHPGAVGEEHLQDYLDKFAFRSNPHKSRSRGKLFFPLAQQAAQ